ncbi:hypothetical protein L1887_50826 [Cichorium endivia]|nr:hypothetical protein L1887_50826 [Cichorium endivia]
MHEQEEEQRRISLSSVRSAASASAQAAAVSESVGDVSGESGVTSASDPSSKRPHPVLDKHDIQVARGLFGNLSIDGAGEASQAVPMTSPLPITPLLEEAGVRNATMPQRSDTITPRTSAFCPVEHLAILVQPGRQRRRRFGGASQAHDDAFGGSARHDRRTGRVWCATHRHGDRVDADDVEPERPAFVGPERFRIVVVGRSTHGRADRAACRDPQPAPGRDGVARQRPSGSRASCAMASNETEATVTAAGSERGAPESNERTPPRQSSSDSWGKPFPRRVDLHRAAAVPAGQEAA